MVPTTPLKQTLFSEATSLPDSVPQPPVAVASSEATQPLQADLEQEQEASVPLGQQVVLVARPLVPMLSVQSPVDLALLRTPLALEVSAVQEASARLTPLLAQVLEAALERLSAVKFQLRMAPPVLPSTL